MTDPRWAQISEVEAAVDLDVRSCCAEHVTPVQSPIDGVYEYLQSTITLGPQDALDQNPALGRLILLGFVSAVDDYFRRVLSGIVRICPLSRARVSEKPVPFGALDYYDPAQTGLALFENTSFASLKDLKTQTENVTGLRMSSASLVAAIQKFEGLCHLRHAATHAGGALSSRNARELGMKSGGTVYQVRLTETQLQLSASVCYSAVRAYNRWLYRGIIQQWIGERLLVADWATDQALLVPLFELFRSEEDCTAPATAYHSFVSMRPVIVSAAEDPN